MSDQVWIAVVSCVSTVAVTLGSVLVAYFKLREGQRVIATHTNGLLTAAQEQTAKATDALATVAQTAVERATPPHQAPPSS